MEDSGIIELFGARDERAISEVSAKYGAFARTLARRLLPTAEDAEECVQDAYMALWNTIPPERPRSLRSYLGRITRNIAVNLWHRATAARRDAGLTVLLSELEDCVPGPGTPERELEARELAGAVSAWLRTLPADDRALFLRRYYYGEELNALAREWGVPGNRLAQRMHRLRLSLRKSLEKEDLLP